MHLCPPATILGGPPEEVLLRQLKHWGAEKKITEYSPVCKAQRAAKQPALALPRLRSFFLWLQGLRSVVHHAPQPQCLQVLNKYPLQAAAISLAPDCCMGWGGPLSLSLPPFPLKLEARSEPWRRDLLCTSAGPWGPQHGPGPS